MPRHSVNLTEHVDSFSNAGVAEGEGLRLLQAKEKGDETKLEWLRAAAKEGFDAIDRGDYVTLRSGKEIEDFLREIRQEVSAALPADS